MERIGELSEVIIQLVNGQRGLKHWSISQSETHVPLTLQGYFPWFGDITKSLFLWIFFLLLSLTISFFVTDFIQEQGHGILGVAVEIKCSNLRGFITGLSVDDFFMLSFSFSTTSYI